MTGYMNSLPRSGRCTECVVTVAHASQNMTLVAGPFLLAGPFVVNPNRVPPVSVSEADAHHSPGIGLANAAQLACLRHGRSKGG